MSTASRAVITVIALLLIGALGAASYWYFILQADQGARNNWGPQGPVPVETLVAPTETVPLEINALGTLEADQSIRVTTEISGIVTRIAFSDGQKLGKGAVVIELNDDNERADLARAKATLALTEANYRRSEALLKRGTGAEVTRDQALNAYRVAQANVEVAEAALAKTRVRAPFSGTIGLREVSVGEYIRPGDTIATLADLDNLRIDFQLPDIYLAEIKEGQQASIALDSFPDRTFTGSITAIDPLIDEAGRSLRVRAALPNPDGILRPGLFGAMTIVVGERANSVVVPEAAVVPNPKGGTAIYVVDADNKAHMQSVTLGERFPGRVEIRSGIEPGETIVVTGQLRLQEGDEVRSVGSFSSGEDGSGAAPSGAMSSDTGTSGGPG